MTNKLGLVVILILSFLVTSCAVHRNPQPLAIESHDYALAFTQCLQAAKMGNAAAQYKVGYMYYYGIGTERDQDIGRDWIRRSACQNYPPAIVAMREITRIHQIQDRT